MPRLAVWAPLLFAAFAKLAWAQEPAEAAEEAQHEGAEHGHHKNAVGVLVANTYVAEVGANIFTTGGEYARRPGERASIIGEFEYAPGPNAWVFVTTVSFKIVRQLEVFAGPGIEHRSRRSVESAEAGERGEREGGEAEVRGNNKLLFRFGAGYHVSLSERLYLLPHVAVDFDKRGARSGQGARVRCDLRHRLLRRSAGHASGTR